MPAAWWSRQAAAVGNRMSAAAGRVMLERDAGRRASRLRAAAGTALRQRRSPTRERMRVLVVKPGGRLAWKSVAVPPPPGPWGAVVRPLAVATCDMDRPLILGATPFPVPLALGHECVAEVLAVGSEVATIEPGRRVVVPFQISCGNCAACEVGRTGNCLAVPPLSMYGFGVVGGHWGGALAEQLAVPFADAMLVALPDEVDPAAAASVADNVSDGYRHIGPHLPELLKRDPGARVLVIGAVTRRHLFTPSVSLYAGLVARALGAREVALVDARAAVRRRAQALGLAAATPEQARQQAPAPLVADISASPAGLRLAIALTAPDGLCSSAGSLHATARLPVGLMFGRNVTVTIARAHSRAVIPDVLELMGAGRLAPERVTTAVADFADAHTALTDHVRGASVKTVITAAP